MIPDTEVERVREAADIVQIIGEHVELRRVGADWRGPCPFHHGTHRNFSVSPRRASFYCFVCHEGGDVFTFVRKHLGLDWPSTVRLVAEKSGIEIRETEGARQGPDPREPFWEINAAAAQFFRTALWDDNASRAAREYLEGRGIGRDEAERFGLGFAPADTDAVRDYLVRLGFDVERQLAAGLLVQREEMPEPRARFRGRLIFPILDASGRHVGFGGRLLGPGEPKYLNSAESPVFSKGRLLYGLSWAKHAIRREGRVLVVEGYFDAMRVALSGIDEVVAPLGTALTADQAAMIARYTKNVFLLYDSDPAGRKATFRAANELLARTLAVRVVTLPKGEDPDTFVRSQGRKALEAQLDASADVFELMVHLLERTGWFADLFKRRRAIDRLLPTLRATADAVTRDLYLSRLSEASGVDRAVLAREVEAGRGAWRAESAGDQGARDATRSGSDPTARDDDRREPMDRRHEPRRATDRPPAGAAAERELVRAMLIARSQVDSIARRAPVERFRDARYREIFTVLTSLGPDSTPDEIAGALSPDAAAVLAHLLEEPGAIVDVQRTINDSLLKLEVRELADHMAKIDRAMKFAKPEEADALIREKTRVRDEIKQLGGAGNGRYGKSRH